MLCIIETCTNLATISKKTLCFKHYSRIQRNGTPNLKWSVEPIGECLHCQTKLEGRSKLYCSIRCRSRYNRRLGEKEIITECLMCGETLRDGWEARKNITKFCSAFCRTKCAMLKRKYGITPETYNDLLKQQNSRCKICNNFMDRPYVDHDHTAKIVRGLLCQWCNTGIGFLRHDPSLLASAIQYLQ